MNRDVCEHFNPVDLPCDKCKSANVQKSTLRGAAQQALEALWYYHATEFGRDTPAGKAITTLQGALAEPVQEPVAWRWGYRSITTGEMDWRGYVEIAADPNLRSPAIIMEPLYAAPPQRKPLTEEAIKQLLFESAGMTVTFSAVDLSLARAIEQAHGIV